MLMNWSLRRAGGPAVLKKGASRNDPLLMTATD
jgi:hypothetical protein